MIRILQVFTIMNRGGSESMIMNYYRNIDRTKVQFDFLVHRPNEKGVFDDEIKKLGGTIYTVDPINIFNTKKYYQQLRVFFNKHVNKYSIVHSHLNTFSCYPLKIAEEYGISTRIAHAHTALPKVTIKDFSSKAEAIEALKMLTKLQLRKKIHKYTTHCFSCGQKAGEWLFGKKNDFKIINNAINASKFTYDKAIADNYKDQNNLEGQLIIGHIGNFTEPKNHSFIIDVFYELNQLKSDSCLVLIGDGPMRKAIEAKVEKLGIKEKVHFLGVRTDIPDLCIMLDIFIFPSFYEGLPVTLVEAQSADLLIFASDTITKEVKITDKLTYLSISESPKFWAQKIFKQHNYERINTLALIKERGYDIKQNAFALQEFYLDQIK